VDLIHNLSEPSTGGIHILQTNMTEKPGNLESIPLLPLRNAAQVIRSNIIFTTYLKSSGFRFAGMNPQGIVPSIIPSSYFHFRF
jgi:hypothetical protein